MFEVGNDEVVARLEKIERENRILKRIVALMVLGLGALFVIAQAPSRPRTLEAERLVIRYPNGKEAIVLGTGNNGDIARADFLQPGGAPGIWMSAGSRDSSVYVRSPNGQQQIYMQATLQFRTADVARSDFRTPVGEAVDLGISAGVGGSKQPQYFLLSSDTSGETTQYIYSENGAQLRLTNGPGGAAVALLDNPKTVRAVLGKTNLETVRSGSVETLPLSSLVLFDKEGKVLWRAP